METLNITPDTLINVHFDDLDNPTRIQYAIEYNSKPFILSEQRTNKADFDELRALSDGEIYGSREEGVYLNYFEVRNGDLNTPFDTEMVDWRTTAE